MDLYYIVFNNDYKTTFVISCCRLIASRYPVGIGGLFYPSTLQHLHQQQQQQHQHHSRLAAAASSALSNAVQVTGQSPDIVDADGIRGVLLGGAGWPFPWRPAHSLQTLEHPSPSDVVGTISRVSPASASFPQRGEFDSLSCLSPTQADRDGLLRIIRGKTRAAAWSKGDVNIVSQLRSRTFVESDKSLKLSFLKFSY